MKEVKEELSYFRLNLVKYLAEEHPLLLLDKAFVSERSDEAASACSEAIISGEARNADEGIHLALYVLYEGLERTDHSYATIHYAILENDLAPEEEAEELAIELLPIVEKAMTDTGLIEIEPDRREQQVESLIHSLAEQYIKNKNGL